MIAYGYNEGFYQIRSHRSKMSWYSIQSGRDAIRVGDCCGVDQSRMIFIPSAAAIDRFLPPVGHVAL